MIKETADIIVLKHTHPSTCKHTHTNTRETCMTQVSKINMYHFQTKQNIFIYYIYTSIRKKSYLTLQILFFFFHTVFVLRNVLHVNVIFA